MGKPAILGNLEMFPDQAPDGHMIPAAHHTRVYFTYAVDAISAMLLQKKKKTKTNSVARMLLTLAKP